MGPTGKDYDLFIYNSAGTQLGTGAGSTATETVTLNSQAAGTYYIKVIGYGGANSATCYTITAAVSAAARTSKATAPTSTNSSVNKISIQENVTSASNLQLVPNPIQDVLYIKGLKSTSIINVFNALGQSIEKVTLEGGSTHSINTSAWKKGFYSIKITNKITNISSTYKIIKE